MTWHEWACPACPISSLKNKFVTLIAGSGKRKNPPTLRPLHIPGGLLRCHTQSAWTQRISPRGKAEAAQSEAGRRLPGAPGRRGRPHFHGQLGSILRQEHLLRGDSGGHPRPAQAGERAANTYRLGIQFFTGTRGVGLSRSRPDRFQISSRTATRATVATETQAQRRVIKTCGSHQTR